VTKLELGMKRRCNSCNTKFFDLNKDPIVCPKCLAVFAPPQPDPVPSRRAPGRQAWPPQRVTKVPNDLIPLEGTNADEESKSPTADVEEVDEGVPLLDEQDGQLDATEIISADIEKDDT
jgi:uncharacterized protein (TIGR02300 family)